MDDQFDEQATLAPLKDPIQDPVQEYIRFAIVDPLTGCEPGFNQPCQSIDY